MTGIIRKKTCVAQLNRSPSGLEVISGKKKPQQRSLSTRFSEIIADEAQYADKDAPGPKAMKNLSESERDREAFFLWAFEQNPEMLLLMNRFLSSGFRKTEALNAITELLRDAGKMIPRDTEAKMEFLRNRFYKT